MKIKTYTVEEAKKKMEYYCAYQERSHFEVENKLKEMRIIPKIRDIIIVHLISENFLNEERFAKIFARSKFYQKKWGKNKIISGLKQHKIHPKLIEKSLLEINKEDYFFTIRQLISKKKTDYKESNHYLLKQKIYKFLYQKGFSSDDISAVYND